MFADLGGLNIVEMLLGTSLLAIVGTGEQVPQQFQIGRAAELA